MAKPVRVTITGPEDIGLTAPSADDLLGQVRDLLEVLRSVELSVGSGSTNQLVWRVTNASMNSPISLELTPFGHNPAVSVELRAEKVERATADGFIALRNGEIRPPHFTDKALSKARKMHARVLNGLAETTLSFDDTVRSDPIMIDRPTAQNVERFEESAKGAVVVPYDEVGSIEGFVTKPELDGFGRAILRMRDRLSGEEVKAYASGDAFHQVEELRLADVWEGVRVRVYGRISYKELGKIEQISATGIEVLEGKNLPGIDDILDPNFTGSLGSEEFLRKQRAANG